MRGAVRHRMHWAGTRRFGAAAAAVAVVAAALTVGGATIAPAPAAHAAPADSVNPMTVNGGFTVYSRGNAFVSNSEMEGSIAVGGALTMQTSASYGIAHYVAGTAAYAPPTVDDDPTRLLIGSYNPDAAENPGRVEITNAGALDDSQRGDLKVVNRGGPLQTSQRDTWLRYGPPADSDTPPLIDARNQTYPADATPPSTSAGNGSMYTYHGTPDDTGTADIVADYVAVHADAGFDDVDRCLASVPTGGHELTGENYGGRVVLSNLVPGVPNYIDYADLAGAQTLQFSGNVPNASTPLIIIVQNGVTDIPGLTIDPQGTYSPFLLWDLSRVTNSVLIHSGSRIDGSVYAPHADLTITAAPWDGQILGNTVNLQGGGETHSFMFASTIPCQTTEPSGNFSVSKALSGVTADQLANDATFTVGYVAVLPDGTRQTGTLSLDAQGTTASPATGFPYGTTIALVEVPADDSLLPPGYEWTDVGWSGPTVFTIDATNPSPELVVTNTASEAETTGFSVTKTISGSGDTDVPSDAEFGLEYSVDDGDWIPVTVTPGDPISVQGLSTGSTITIRETSMPDIDHITWGTPTWTVDGQALTPADDGSVSFTLVEGESVSLTLTNEADADASVNFLKQVVGSGASAVPDGTVYTVSYSINGGPEITGQVEANQLVTVDDIPAGAMITVHEVDMPDIAGIDWSDPAWTLDGVPLQPDADGTLTFTVQGGETLALQLTNTANGYGTLQAEKTVTGPAADQVPADTQFTVSYHVDNGPEVTQAVTANVPVVFGHLNTGIHVFVKEGPMPNVPGVTWGDPTWTVNGEAVQPDADGYVEFVADTGTQVTLGLANYAQTAPSGGFSVTKTVTGSAASVVPSDTVFTVTYSVDGSPDQQVPVKAGVTTTVGDIPVGSTVTFVEATPPSVPGVTWGTPTWTVDGKQVSDPTITIGEDETVAIGLTNTADASGGTLPDTGSNISGAVWWGIGLLGVGLMAGFVALLRRRRA